jgi:hypothetical protein
LADVVRWMLKEGGHHTRMREFDDEMCRRIVAAGIPLWRGFCAAGTTLFCQYCGSRWN